MEAEAATPFILASSSMSSSSPSLPPEEPLRSGSSSKISSIEPRVREEREESPRKVLALDLFLPVQSQNQTFAANSSSLCHRRCRCRLLFFHPCDLGGREGKIEESTAVVWSFFKENGGEAGKRVGSPEGGRRHHRRSGTTQQTRHRQRRCGERCSCSTARASSAAWASDPVVMAPLMALPIHFTPPPLGRPRHLSTIIPTLIEMVPIVNVVIDIDEVPPLGCASMVGGNRCPPLGERIGPAPTRGPPGMLDASDNGVEGDQAATGGAEKEEEEKRSLKRQWGSLGVRERRTRSRSRVM